MITIDSNAIHTNGKISSVVVPFTEAMGLDYLNINPKAKNRTIFIRQREEDDVELKPYLQETNFVPIEEVITRFSKAELRAKEKEIREGDDYHSLLSAFVLLKLKDAYRQVNDNNPENILDYV